MALEDYIYEYFNDHSVTGLTFRQFLDNLEIGCKVYLDENNNSLYLNDFKWLDEIKETRNNITERKQSMKKRKMLKEGFEEFSDKDFFDAFKNSIGGNCFSFNSVKRWLYKMTDLMPDYDDVVYIMDSWVDNKWAIKKKGKMGSVLYYFDYNQRLDNSTPVIRKR